jgi:hypothetical protein
MILGREPRSLTTQMRMVKVMSLRLPRLEGEWLRPRFRRYSGFFNGRAKVMSLRTGPRIPESEDVVKSDVLTPQHRGTAC